MIKMRPDQNEAIATTVAETTANEVNALEAEFKKTIKEHCETQQAHLSAIRKQLQTERDIFSTTSGKIERELYIWGGNAFESVLKSAIDYKKNLNEHVTKLDAAIASIDQQINEYKKIQNDVDKSGIKKSIDAVKTTDKKTTDALSDKNNPLLISEQSVGIIKKSSEGFFKSVKNFASSALSFVKKHKGIIAAGILLGVGLGLAATGLGLAPGLIMAAKGALSMSAIAGVAKAGAVVVGQGKRAEKAFDEIAEEGAKDIKRARGEPVKSAAKSTNDEEMKTIVSHQKMSEIVTKPTEIAKKATQFEQDSSKFEAQQKRTP